MSHYTFHNKGTISSFIPNKRVMGDDNRPTTALNFHLHLVEEADRHDVFILDRNGREVQPHAVAA